MKIIARLTEPYTKDERRDFILYYGQNCRQELPTCYEIQETEDALIALGPDEKELRLQEINSELQQAETEYTEKLNTPIPVEVKENISHMYKPKWAEEIYISLLTAGQLMPSMFPMLIWDATELEGNAIELTLAELTTLTMKLAAVQQAYFNERKAKKSALLEEKEQLLKVEENTPIIEENEEPEIIEEQ